MRLRSLLVLASLAFSPLEAYDPSAFDRILRQYVDEEGLVDYAAIQQNAAADLDAFLADVAKADLKGWPYEAKLAFWINAYNANAIKLVLTKPGMKKMDFTLFNRPATMAGAAYTLNDVEHRVLRGQENMNNRKGAIPGVTLERFDPRIHFALVCAAMDCPRLRTFAYTAENVQRTLQENAERFANHPKHLSVVKGQLRISSLMKWYEDDFRSLGGVPAYLMGLTDAAKRDDEVLVDRLLRLNYDKAEFVYDWTVNDVRNAKK
jgi:hypothetical protein